MAKIRQEINIIDATVTASASTTTTDVAIVQLDTTQYSGTVTYYFEIVGNDTSGSGTSTARLRRKGTSTDDATVTFNNTGSPARARSASFTPPSGQTEYVLALSAPSLTNCQVVAARILVFQNATTLTNTETQVEIGNKETAKSNTTDAALNNPKYFKYNSAQWDGTITAYAEVTYLRSSSMDTTTIKLQKDGGSDNFTFSDDTTIVSAGTATSATRVRVSFTPTTGRNYRIVGVSSSNMSTYDIYSAKIIIDQVLTGSGGSGSGASRNVQGGTGTSQALAEEFTGVTDAYAVTFQLKKVGTPSDNVVVDIVSSLGGSSLATANIAGSSLSTSFTNTTFSFSSPATGLSSGTTYYVQVTRSGSRDTSNYYTVSTTTPSTNYTGNIWTNDSGSWTEVTNEQFIPFSLAGASGITKLEPQYLLLNSGAAVSTGLQHFDTYYDPSEWDVGSGSITYIHEGNGVASGTVDVKLQSDPTGTPADITGSTITDVIQREQSSSLTMPGAATAIDVNVTGTGTLTASRILAQYIFTAVTGTNYTQTLNETLTITDELVRRAGKALLETLAITDTLKRDISAIKSETLSITDTLTKLIQKSLTEAITITDVLNVARIYLKELLETLTITDTLSKLVGWIRSETLNVTDTVNKAISKPLTTETLTVTDVITKQAQKPLTESYTVSDVLTKQTGKPLPDSLVITDAVKKDISTTKTEIITLSDTLTKQTSKPLTETITITDVLAIIRTFLKELTETIVLSDTVTKVTSKVLVETLTFTDSVLKLTYKLLTETLGLEDSLLAEKTAQAQATVRRLLMRVGI